MASRDSLDDPDGEQDDPADSFDALLRSAAHTPSQLRPGTLLAGGRYRIVRALGQGGMGIVYEALDTARSEQVALKTLTRVEPQAVYRLKHEFRALADVAHPNLVALREFVVDDELWFFTMDMLHGQSFLAYVRGDELAPGGDTLDASAPGYDEARLRTALAQLVQGVVALHQAGKLHCDLKPGNIMISPTGHLTILDFGLVSERSGTSTGRTLGPEWAGTPGYMAPEQMRGWEISPATDYYALGAILFEALSGKLPFHAEGGVHWPGRPLPEIPAHLLRSTSLDLRDLCLELLAFDPRERPSEASLLQRTVSRSARSSRPSLPERNELGLFVGRRRELAQLSAQWFNLEPGRPRALFVSGPSGIGKTRLVREFLRNQLPGGEAVVLEGRCYERESVPFNAFDSLIDALSRYLRRLPEVRAVALMPRDAKLLTQLFPVLDRLTCVHDMPAPSRYPNEPLVVRRRAFEALKELFNRISDLAPLVLCIDDMHWADRDSLQLFEALLAPDNPPRLLLVGVFHADHAAKLAEVAALCQRQQVAHLELPLAPLEEREQLALIADKLTLPEPEARRLAGESNGNPFFLGELIAADVPQRSGDLRGVILARAEQLSSDVRRLIDLLCVAGAPIEIGVALAAAGVAQQGQALITELRNERWLRIDPSGNAQRIEIYHGRIRELLCEVLSPEQRARLAQPLAERLEASAEADPERVARYWLEAGLPERAAQGFARAAARAERNLAFVSAAHLFALALLHGQFERDARQQLRLSLAGALERAGHAIAAAEAYLEAARDEPDRAVALDLRREAAQLLLASGSLEAGTNVLREVLAEVSLAYPEQPEQALTGLALAQRELEARAFQTDPARAPNNADQAEQLRRMADACWAAGPALGSYDFVRSGYFARHGLLFALDSGDALRVARALAMLATSTASGGDTALAETLAQRSRALADQVGDAKARANAELVLGQIRLFTGDFADALAACDHALALFRGQNAGESLEVPLCAMFANMALHLSGRLPELVQRAREQLQSARERGHIQAEASVRVLGVALGNLLEDDVAQARRQGELSAQLWPQAQLHAERFKVLRLEAWCDLYEGQGARAFARWAAARAGEQGALLLPSRYWSFWWFDLAAATALAAAAESGEPAERARMLAEADAAIAELARLQPSYVRTPLCVYRAACAELRGDRARALDGLRTLCADSRPLVAASAQVKLGTLLGGPEGAALQEMGTRTLEGWVKSPTRWVAFTLPGFS